jgi:hypothetical protein
MSIQNFNSLILAWHGVDGDTRIFLAEMTTFSDKPPAAWSPGRVIGQSFAAPAMAANQDGSTKFVAVMGPGSPSAIQFSSIIGPPGPTVPPSFQTSARPAVAVSAAGHIRLAWRSPDGALTSAEQAGSGWGPPTTVGRTSHSPAMAAAGNGFVLAWKPDNGVQIMGATTGGVTKPMHPQDGGMLTSDAPALCNRAGDFLMAWKGVPGDERIFWSRSRDGLNWETPREAIPLGGGIRTIAGPAITAWRLGFVMVWRGVNGDQGLWWSTLGLNDPSGRWSTPARVSLADNSNSSPTLLSCSAQTL